MVILVCFHLKTLYAFNFCIIVMMFCPRSIPNIAILNQIKMFINFKTKKGSNAFFEIFLKIFICKKS